MTLPFEELLLSHIAHHYFVKNEYFFDKSELSNFISEYIGNNLNAPKFLDGSKILEAISVQQGILVERAKNIYSFSHLTFQEYFTAKYIDDHTLTETYIKEYLFQPRWREIFILLCGILKSGSDKMLDEIYSKTLKDIESDSDFQNILIGMNTFDSDKDADIRLLNLLIILLFGTDFSTINNSRLILSILWEINPQLYEQVSYSWIMDKKPQNDMHYELYIALTDQLKSSSKVIEVLKDSFLEFHHHKSLLTLKNSFCKRINLDFVIFNESSKDTINSYFENLIFLFYCKKSSILVTKNNWRIIESSLFKNQ